MDHHALGTDFIWIKSFFFLFAGDEINVAVHIREATFELQNSLFPANHAAFLLFQHPAA